MSTIPRTPVQPPREKITCPRAPRKPERGVLNENHLNISKNLNSTFEECAAADGFTTPPPSPRNNVKVCPWAPARPLRDSM